jgi:hypothetical protein
VPRVIQVLAEIPLLGTGKTDYVQLKKLAEETAGATAAGAADPTGTAAPADRTAPTAPAAKVPVDPA